MSAQRPAVASPNGSLGERFAIADLEQKTGVNARTIRYYVSEGLLPAAIGRGPSATYTPDHLHRLQLIAMLKAEHLPLDEIGRRLAGMTNAQIAAALDLKQRPPGDLWQRIALHPDLELAVRQRPGDTPNLALEEAVTLILDLCQPVLERLERSERQR